MSTETIWAVIGISVSAIFGVIGVYLTIKSRYPGRITFVDEQTIELFDAIGSSVDHLEITYGGDTVSENLVLLNGAFINSGKTDITSNMVEKPISLRLPAGFKWLTGRVIKSEVDSSLNLIDDYTIEIPTGLFRCGECIRFHALAQLPDDKNQDESNAEKLHKSISFEHRITNTKAIDQTVVKTQEESKKKLKRLGIPFTIMLLVTIVMAGYALYSGAPRTLAFPYTLSDGTTELVSLKLKADDMVKVTSIESDFEAEETFLGFTDKLNGKPSLGKPVSFLMLYGVLGLQILLCGLLLFTLVFEYTKNKRLIRLITKL